MLLRDFLFAQPYQGSNLYLRPTTAGALSHYTNDLISAFPISELYRLHRDWSVQMKAHFNKDLYSLFSCLLQNTIKSICIVTNLYLRILLCIIISGAADRTRTGTRFPPADFKSAASTYSATAAFLDTL